MIFYQYYLEIKNRFFLLILSWSSLVICCYSYKEILLIGTIKITYTKSLNNIKLYFIFTDIKELFDVYLKLIFFISNQICIIILLYHIFLFLYLGLHKLEYIKFKYIVKTILFCWILTIFFSYKYIIPFSWFFFESFQQKSNSTNIVTFFFEAKILEYLNFFIQISSISILSFQFLGFSFLLLDYFFAKIKIKIIRKCFYFVVILFSTIITPPDLLSQVLVSIFLVLYYEMYTFVKCYLKLKKVF